MSTPEALAFEESLKEFSALESDSERARFCLKLIQQETRIKIVAKSQESAAKARKIGNEEFKDGNLVAALEFYNRSLCLAPPDSPEVALAYANRSAVYLKLNRFDLCLENVDAALSVEDVSNKLREKLETRREECLRAKEEADGGEAKSPVELEPFVSEWIQMAENEGFGRHLIATHDLRPGELVICENPVSPTLYPKSQFRLCANCMSSRFYSLYPCQNCTFAMFCSEKCSNAAFEAFHRIECPIMSELGSVGLAKVARITLLALNLHNSEEIQSIQSVLSPFTTRKPLLEVYSLKFDENRRKKSDLFEAAMSAAFIFDLFRRKTNLKAILESEKQEILLLDLFFAFSLTCDTQWHSMLARGPLTHSSELKSQPLVEFGAAIYPISSLINHSCVPNVGKINVGENADKILIYVRRPIKAGEQLFDSYGRSFDHLCTPRDQRSVAIMQRYKFECKCEACAKDFPTIDKLKKADLETKFLDQPIEEQDESILRENLQKCGDFLASNNDHYPCMELFSAQMFLIEGLLKTYTRSAQMFE